MSDNRIHYLDGLRGVLAVSVFIHHFVYIFIPELILGGPADQFVQPGVTIWKIIALTPVNILFNPTMAINFFFLLSGYVQSFHYLKNPDLRLLQASFLKRYFRLVIPTLVVVMLVYLFHKLHFFHKELLPASPITGGWVASQLPDNLNFFQMLRFGIFDCFQGRSGYYQVLWTMAVELMNSWMVILLLFATHHMKHRNRFLLLWLLVQIVLLKSTHSISFTVGVLLCSLHRHSTTFTQVMAQPLPKYFCLLAGLYLASYPIMEYQDSLKNSMYLPILYLHNDIVPYIIGNIFLFAFILHAPRLKQFFTKKPFQFLGDISFAVYLVHFLLLFSFSAKVYFSLRQSVGFGTNLVITFLATSLATALVSMALYRYVDKPGLRFTTRYVKKSIGL